MADTEQKKTETAKASTAAKKAAEQKPFGTSPGGLLWLGALGSSLLALVVYGCTLTQYLYPGKSAGLYTQWLGLDPLPLPIHPIWGWLVKAIGGGSAVSLNVVSLLCGVLSAGFLCYLVGFFVFQAIGQEDTVKHAKTASLLAGIGSAAVFVFSTAVWSTSTHLDVRQFDVFLALSVFMLFVPLVRFPRLTYVISPLIGFAVAVGAVEGVVFVPLLAVYLLALVATVVKNGFRFYVPTALFLVALVAGFLYLAFGVADAFMQLPGTAVGEYKESADVLWACVNDYKSELHSWLFSPGRLVVALLSILPFIACTFASSRGLNNERTWSQYLFHASMTVCCVLAVATPLAPESMLRSSGSVPVATTTLIAATCGYLLAYWYLLARVPLPATEYDAKTQAVLRVGRGAAPFVGCGLAVLLLLAGIVNAFSRDGERGAYADVCANEILDRLGERTWMITDGSLDEHLRVAAAARGLPLNIICIKPRKESEYTAYCRQIAGVIEGTNLTAGNKTSSDLSFTIKELGMLDFLKMWFRNDPDITKKVAIFRTPDFWFWANCRPVPEGLFFGGAKDAKSIDALAAKADFNELWNKLGPSLAADGWNGSRGIRSITDVTDRRRLDLRRHMGFLANNIGVLLQDHGHDAEAFETYELVLGTIDPDNICTLFNEYEMARAGKKVPIQRKKEIEQQLKEIVDDSSRRYLIQSLSSYYGYIRSPEFFVRSGISWARSGEVGYALAQLKYAIDLAPGDRPADELLNMMASYYAQGRQVMKSREKYHEVLAKDASNHDALIGLWRLSLQEGAVEEAKGYLERAVKASDGKEESSRFDVALLHMMNNNLEGARMSLQKVTDLQPHSLQAWALLAGVILQQADKVEDAAKKRKVLAEIDNAILPKMEALADSPRDFFVQMTRALVLMRKGNDPETMKEARRSLELAWLSRPVVSVGGMVLDLDYKLLDREGAERHALQILRMDPSHVFANWVMGSIRMGEGKMSEAERFLRIAVDGTHPLPAAQNDLAELLRQDKRLEEAEKYARAATRTDPRLYVAWETLCATLLDKGVGLDEAELCIKKALELSKGEDVRMKLTLARVQVAKNDMTNARITLRELGKHRDELSDKDIVTLDELQKASQGKK